jgi:hypothetical protein
MFVAEARAESMAPHDHLVFDASRAFGWLLPAASAAGSGAVAEPAPRAGAESGRPLDPSDAPAKPGVSRGKRAYRVLARRDHALTSQLLAALKNFKPETLQAKLDDALAALAVARERRGAARAAPRAAAAPEGATRWIGVTDVIALLGCSKSYAHRCVRAAAGRSAGTGALLRVPLKAWEAWAEIHLVDGRMRKGRRWESTSTSAGRSGGGSSTSTASESADRPARPTRRQLGPFSPAGSKLPPIRDVKPRRRP